MVRRSVRISRAARSSTSCCRAATRFNIETVASVRDAFDEMKDYESARYADNVLSELVTHARIMVRQRLTPEPAHELIEPDEYSEIPMQRTADASGWSE
jgi:hypothetical protein